MGKKYVIKVGLSATDFVRLRQLRKFLGFAGSDAELLIYILRKYYSLLYDRMMSEFEVGKK